MKRRVLSLVLALVLVLCMIPISAFAAQTQKTSDTLIAMIKHFEGFSAKPYEDHGQWTVGYGTRCPAEDLERYLRYGITEAEATALLKEFIASFENSVNSFTKKYNLDLTQNEFDALVSFTYNVGPRWMSDPDGLVTRAVIEGATGNAFIFAMTMWCTASGQVLEPLIERRLIEANVYINADYSVILPSNYCYVTFDHTDSTYNGESRVVRVQGYDAAATDVVRPVAVRSGYRFLGWYTAASGGAWVSNLDASTSGKKLYAHWQSGDGVVSGGAIQGTAARYERTTTGAVKVYTKPATSAAVKYTLNAGAEVTILADYVDASGAKWGKLNDGGWLQLTATEAEKNPAEDPSQGTLVTVTRNVVNVRSGPGTGYSRVDYAYRGEKLLITETKTVNGNLWGKFNRGWISLDCTDYGTEPQKPVATGTVKLSSGRLNVRSGAGSGYGIVASLANGTRVEIFEITTSGGTRWGRVDKGWISMNYVVLDAAEEEKPTEAPTQAPTEAPTQAPTQAPTEAPTQAPTEAPTEAPTQPPVENDKTDKVVATGTVKLSSGSLNVRSGAGTGYSKVGSLKNGARVQILEIKTVSGTQWGRISNGWISLNYVKLDPTASEEKEVSTGTVNITSGTLNVRSGAGTGYAVVAKLQKGATVKIYETKTVSSVTWGRCDQGWVSMKYIKLNSSGSGSSGSGSTGGSGSGSTGGSGSDNAVSAASRTGTVTAANLINVRSGPGTTYSKVGTVRGGTKVTVTELKMVYGTGWGKTASGWICLDYVKLDTPKAGAPVLIDAYNLNVRAGAGTGYSKVGTYTKGDLVTALETKKVGSTTWARTTKGWFSMDYAI